MSKLVEPIPIAHEGEGGGVADLMLQRQERTRLAFGLAPQRDRPWSVARKVLVMVAAAILAWIVWGAAGLLIWQSLRP